MRALAYGGRISGLAVALGIGAPVTIDGLAACADPADSSTSGLDSPNDKKGADPTGVMTIGSDGTVD